MAKLTGPKKKAFLERMAKGRRKAARKNPKKKPARKPANKKGAKKPVKKAAKNRTVVLKSLKDLRRHYGRSIPKEMISAVQRGKSVTVHSINPQRKKKRPNSDDASKMYTTFHGKAPGRIVEYDELVNFPQHFAELGRLVELRIDLDSANRRFPITSFRDCKVVCTPDGENIYFVGGDQRIDLSSLEIGGDKDMVELGPCVYICYHTTKDFHEFAPTDYYHEFGEENGIRPVLGYDRLNRKLFLIGGDYRVKREGIVN